MAAAVKDSFSKLSTLDEAYLGCHGVPAERYDEKRTPVRCESSSAAERARILDPLLARAKKPKRPAPDFINKACANSDDPDCELSCEIVFMKGQVDLLSYGLPRDSTRLVKEQLLKRFPADYLRENLIDIGKGKKFDNNAFACGAVIDEISANAVDPDIAIRNMNCCWAGYADAEKFALETVHGNLDVGVPYLNTKIQDNDKDPKAAELLKKTQRSSDPITSNAIRSSMQAGYEFGISRCRAQQRGCRASYEKQCTTDVCFIGSVPETDPCSECNGNVFRYTAKDFNPDCSYLWAWSLGYNDGLTSCGPPQSPASAITPSSSAQQITDDLAKPEGAGSPSSGKPTGAKDGK